MSNARIMANYLTEMDSDSFVATYVSAVANGGIEVTTGSSYSNTDVDAHLNTGTATSGEVLSWTGTDYDWISGGSTAAGQVGSYAFLGQTSASGVSFGATSAGSGLRPAGIEQTAGWNTTARSIEGYADSGTLSGTWRCMGTGQRSVRSTATLWIRIS